MPGESARAFCAASLPRLWRDVRPGASRAGGVLVSVPAGQESSAAPGTVQGTGGGVAEGAGGVRGGGGKDRLTGRIDMTILLGAVSPKEKTALRLDLKLLTLMRRVREREGIPVTTQIEMAVRDWLTKRGTIAKSGRKRATTRKRP